MKWHKQVAPLFASIGLVWCVVVGVYVWITPMIYTRHRPGFPSFKVQVPFSEASALGAVPLLIPVGVALLAVWAAVTGRLGLLVGTALILSALSFVGGFSIGGAYLPAAGILGLAALAAAYEDVRRLGSY